MAASFLGEALDVAEDLTGDDEMSSFAAGAVLQIEAQDSRLVNHYERNSSIEGICYEFVPALADEVVVEASEVDSVFLAVEAVGLAFNYNVSEQIGYKEVRNDHS